METKKFQSRRLTTVEKEFSKILTIPILRKEYIMRLNNGESLENMEEEFKHRLNEALNAKRQAELDEKQHQEHEVWEKQVKYLCDLFVTRKDNETAVFQHAIGYRFLDQAAEQRGFFNGMTLEFIFMGGNFTSSSWLLLTKHRKLIRMLQLDGRATHLLKNMFYTLCRKESIYTEEKNILNVFNLLQVFA